MESKRLAAGIALLLLCGSVHAQPPYYPPAREAFAADSNIVRGNYYLYDFDTPAPTPPPKGYEPFYISTYNRHGARAYGANSGYDRWAKILSEGRGADQLTEAGKDLCRVYMDLYTDVCMRAGELTGIGRDQLRRLGMRMYAAYPSIFRNHPVIDARSTETPRVILSMAAFCDGLKTCDPSLDITRTASRTDRYYLYLFSSTNPYFLPKDKEFEGGRGTWHDDYVALMENHVDAEAFLGRYFKDPSFATENVRTRALELGRLFYNIVADLPCITGDGRLDRFMTPDERFAYWRAENFRFYNVAGRTPVYGGRNWAMMAPMLRNIVETADRDLADGSVQVRLRFGHDYFLIGLVTLLDLDGWNVEEADPEKVDAVFRHYASPMAMNIQWIFYRNREGDILVRVTLNDREVRFRIAGFEGPYYPWTSLRAFCTARLEVAEQILSSTR